MKRNIVIITLIALNIFITSCSDSENIPSSKIPQPVIAAFNAKYPDATGTEWKTEKSDGKLLYEAAFKLAGKSIEAEFYENGTFKQED